MRTDYEGFREFIGFNPYMDIAAITGKTCDGKYECPYYGRVVGGKKRIIRSPDVLIAVDERRPFCEENQDLPWFSGPITEWTTGSRRRKRMVNYMYAQCLNENGEFEEKALGLEVCNGIVDCLPNAEDEAGCTLYGNGFPCNAAGNRVSLEQEELCDGFRDCFNGEDEKEELCGELKFYCSARNGTAVSIDKTQICDGQINCDNAEDEIDCGQDGRYYCQEGDVLFVSNEKIMNGVPECADNSDECPKNRFDIFSSNYNLVGNIVFRAVLWIVAIVSITANAAVLSWELYKMHAEGGYQNSRVSFGNHVLIMNLAVADLVMGVYMLFLSIADALYTGIYCLKSTKWLTSASCQSLGALAVLSSQASVLTLGALSTVRLITVINPFTNHPKQTNLFLGITFIWAFSILMAVGPLMENNGHRFYQTALMKQNLFFDSWEVDFNAFKSFAIKLLQFHPGMRNLTDYEIKTVVNAESWPVLTQFVKSRYSTNVQPTDYYGYYSTNSVCMPKLFASTHDPAWPMAFTFIVINLGSFIYILIAYIIIVVKSNNSSTVAGARSYNRDLLSMTRRVAMLVITDGLCWLPICIIFFLSQREGQTLPDSVYLITACVLLPINSAINPMIYSQFWVHLVKIFRKPDRSGNEELPKFAENE